MAVLPRASSSVVLPALACLVLAAPAIPRVAQADPGDTELVSEHYATATSDRSVYLRDISADGRYVVFITSSAVFVPGGSGGSVNVLVRDRAAGTTSRANLSTTGKAVPVDTLEEAAISADGRYVVFATSSDAVVPGDTNGLTDIFLRDLRAATTEMVSLRSDGQQYRNSAFPSVSVDGRYVAFVAWDSDGLGSMIRVRDRLTRQTRSFVADGLVGSPVLTDDGRYLVYRNYRRIVALNLSTGRTDVVNVSSAGELANDQSHLVGASSDGRYVAFSSAANNLVPGDTNGLTDVFVRDRSLRTTERVSVTDDEQQYRYMIPSVAASISGDGRFVAFPASVRNVGGYDIDDVFVRDRAEGRTRLASINSAGIRANGHSASPVLDAHGRFVAFVSKGSNLAPGDTDAFEDVFAHEFAVTGSPGTALTLAPGTLEFGGIAIGSKSAPKSVTVTNTGTTTLTVSWIGLAGEDREQFSSVRRCPGTLAPGASCTGEVVFAPTSAGAMSARLVVSIDDGALRKSAAVSGTGL